MVSRNGKFERVAGKGSTDMSRHAWVVVKKMCVNKVLDRKTYQNVA